MFGFLKNVAADVAQSAAEEVIKQNTTPKNYQEKTQMTPQPQQASPAPQQQQAGGNMNDLISGMATNYISGMISNNQGGQFQNSSGQYQGQNQGQFYPQLPNQGQFNPQQPSQDQYNPQQPFQGQFNPQQPNQIPNQNFGFPGGQNPDMNNIASSLIQGFLSGGGAPGNPAAPGGQPGMDQQNMIGMIVANVMKGLFSGGNQGKGSGMGGLLSSLGGGSGNSLLMTIASSVLKGFFGGNQETIQSTPQDNKMIGNVTTNVIGGLVSPSSPGSLESIKANGLNKEAVTDIAANVVSGIYGDGDEFDPTEGLSIDNSTDDLAKNITGCVVDGLLSNSDIDTGEGDAFDDDIVATITAAAIDKYKGGQKTQGTPVAADNNDMITNIASSVIGNMTKDSQGEAAMSKTGLDSGLVNGIVSNVISNFSGANQPQQAESGNVTDSMVSAATAAVIKQISNQDSEGKILSGNDGSANSDIVTGIATNVIKNAMGGQSSVGSGGGNIQNAIISSIAAKYVSDMISGKDPNEKKPEVKGDLVANITSQVLSQISSKGEEETEDDTPIKKAGLSQDLVAGIVANVMTNVSGQGQGGANPSNDMVTAVTSKVIKEMVSQDKDKDVVSSDGGANTALISGVATNVITNIMSNQAEDDEVKNLQKGETAANDNVLSGLVSNVVSGVIQNQKGDAAPPPQPPPTQNEVFTGIASNVLGSFLSGGLQRFNAV